MSLSTVVDQLEQKNKGKNEETETNVQHQRVLCGGMKEEERIPQQQAYIDVVQPQKHLPQTQLPQNNILCQRESHHPVTALNLEAETRIQPVATVCHCVQ